MKYSTRNLAAAFVDLAYNQPESNQLVLAQNFLKLVKKNNLEKKLPEILEQVGRLVTKKNGGRVIDLELARNNQKLVEMFKSICRPADVLRVTEKPRLIAGARLVVDQDQLLDYSFNGRLNNLFRGLA